jgi:hypothetical protein
MAEIPVGAVERASSGLAGEAISVALRASPPRKSSIEPPANPRITKAIMSVKRNTCF